MAGWFTTRRRKRLIAEPFPAGWDDIIDRNVVVARELSPAARQRLRERMVVFIAETSWEGCGGQALDEEVQVTIAAQACLLIVDRESDLFRDVESILVYPTTVVRPPRALGVFEQPRAPVEAGGAILGEAHLRGPVVLAWDAVLAGGRGETGGNVVVHELAHKLDMATGAIDGTPPLRTRAARRAWAAACSAALIELRARIALGLPSAIDPYGATNEAELFAVATEAYITAPAVLAADYPALYRVLAEFYRGA